MKQLLVFIRKEFYHVFRDRKTLLIMFGLPMAQILLFGFALTSEVKNVRIAISGNTEDLHSQRIIQKIRASSNFLVESKAINSNEINKVFKKGDIKAVVVFPPGFSSDLIRLGKAQVQIIADGSDPNTAKTLTNYLTSIIADYQKQISPPEALPYTIIPETRMLYNEEDNGSLNFVPGVLALVLMIVCTALTSVAVVR
ncbi:MAG: ABC transporter permease, partial [Bacteroidota bacterium]|nr:ABC transporter permease [Bacteroidota bacterium]